MLPSSSKKIPLIFSVNSCKRDLLTFSVDLLSWFFNTAIYRLLAKQLLKPIILSKHFKMPALSLSVRQIFRNLAIRTLPMPNFLVQPAIPGIRSSRPAVHQVVPARPWQLAGYQSLRAMTVAAQSEFRLAGVASLA